MTSWHDAGFGTDPAGDAARRAEFEHARADRLPELRAASLDRPAPDDEHEVDTFEDARGIGHARCACGAWEAVVAGPRSARWAFEQYAEHVRLVALTRADGHPPG